MDILGVPTLVGRSQEFFKPTVAVMKWESLLPNDTFLIVASSDGAFEKMTMQDVCDLMLYVKLGVKQELGSFAVTQQNLADYSIFAFTVFPNPLSPQNPSVARFA
uniref:Uncharacterized protein n=1 Tax=Oryza barthii TaxID=65489 RepID=A0A0D3GNU1_9ORYZ